MTVETEETRHSGRNQQRMRNKWVTDEPRFTWKMANIRLCTVYVSTVSRMWAISSILLFSKAHFFLLTISNNNETERHHYEDDIILDYIPWQSIMVTKLYIGHVTY